MKLLDLFALIQFVDNGWAFAAFIAVLVYLYLSEEPSGP